MTIQVWSLRIWPWPLSRVTPCVPWTWGFPTAKYRQAWLLYCSTLWFLDNNGERHCATHCYTANEMLVRILGFFSAYWQCVYRRVVHSFSAIFYNVSKDVRVPIYVQFFPSNILIGDCLANNLTCNVPFWASVLLTNWTKFWLLTSLLTSFTFTLANKFIRLYYNDCENCT